MPEIVLYNNQNEEVARAIIDSENIDIVKKYKWRLDAGYAHNNKVGRLHRFLMNPPEDMVVDHINGDRLDNRKCNLRICTQQQNCMNYTTYKNNSSGTPGVRWVKEKNKWKAYISVNGKHKHLGYYNNIEDAIQARLQAEIDYFGEYRRVD